MSAPTEGEAAFSGEHPPALWIVKAQGDLRAAEDLARAGSGGTSVAIAFHCQQAVEKLMKAILISRGCTLV